MQTGLLKVCEKTQLHYSKISIPGSNLCSTYQCPDALQALNSKTGFAFMLTFRISVHSVKNWISVLCTWNVIFHWLHVIDNTVEDKATGYAYPIFSTTFYRICGGQPMKFCHGLGLHPLSSQGFQQNMKFGCKWNSLIVCVMNSRNIHVLWVNLWKRSCIVASVIMFILEPWDVTLHCLRSGRWYWLSKSNLHFFSHVVATVGTGILVLLAKH